MKTKLILTFFILHSSFNILNAQYCQPSGGFGACALGLNDFWITDVSFTGTGSTFAYTGGACVAAAPYYLNTGYTGNVIAGNTYTLSLTREGNTYLTYFNAWVDWDSNAVLNNTTPYIENIASNLMLGAGGGLTSTATVTIPAAATPGIKRMRVRVQYNVTNANNPCLMSGQAESKDFYLNVLPNCASFAVNANVSDDTICTGASVTFTGSGASSYVWNNGVSNGVPFNPLSTNTYIVTGTTGTCVDSASIAVYVVSCAGVNDLIMDNGEFTLSPNPTTWEFQVSGLKFQVESIKITNILGQTVYQSAITNSQSEIRVDVSALANGVYFIQINNTINKKIIKH